MNDYYVEQLVKRKSKIVAKVVLVAVTLMLYALGIFVMMIALIPAAIMTVADVFLMRRLDVEYEYLYVNGDLDIDKIFSKRTRKKAYEVNMKDLIVLAVSGQPELRQYENVKAYDFSSGYKDYRVCEMVVERSGEKERIIFEPNEAIIEGIKRIAPRKVFI